MSAPLASFTSVADCSHPSRGVRERFTAQHVLGERSVSDVNGEQLRTVPLCHKHMQRVLALSEFWRKDRLAVPAHRHRSMQKSPQSLAQNNDVSLGVKTNWSEKGIPASPSSHRAIQIAQKRCRPRRKFSVLRNNNFLTSHRQMVWRASSSSKHRSSVSRDLPRMSSHNQRHTFKCHG